MIDFVTTLKKNMCGKWCFLGKFVGLIKNGSHILGKNGLFLGDFGAILGRFWGDL